MSRKDIVVPKTKVATHKLDFHKASHYDLIEILLDEEAFEKLNYWRMDFLTL